MSNSPNTSGFSSQPSSLPPDVVLRVSGVSKKFCRNLRRSMWYGIQDLAGNLLGRRAEGGDLRPEERAEGGKLKAEGGNFRSQVSSFIPSPPFQVSSFIPHPSDDGLRRDEFWALRDISFDLKRGECLGLIGRNGCGKTTLLRLIAGIFPPDQGEITIRGRVGALIALGAGFHPHMTGRENVYLNGAILGLHKSEIDAQFDEIVDFAEIGEFIDAPVATYSSGMRVRLGFSVATATTPDLLLIDEILAVGDAAFRNKCYGRIMSLRKRSAVIFVSHGMEQVARICDHVLVMSKGQIDCLGPVAEGVAVYEQINDDPSTQDKSFLSMQHPIQCFSLSEMPRVAVSGEPIRMFFAVVSSATIRSFLLRISVYGISGALTADNNYSSVDNGIWIDPGQNSWVVELAGLPLKNGKYRISFNIISQSGDLLVWSYKQHDVQVVGAYVGAAADCQLPLEKWEREKSTLDQADMPGAQHKD